MNLEPFHNYENPANDSTELNGSSFRASTVDETSGGTTSWTWIVYNGDSNTPSAEFNGSGTLLERYLAGPTYVPSVSGMVARTNASGVTDWYLTGKLGSVRDIVDTSETVIDHISYGAFGTVRAETNPTSGSRFKFDGMRYDTITGLYNDWHRGYSSTTGRFDSFDPMNFDAGDSNLFHNVYNQINNEIEPNGMEPEVVGIIGITIRGKKVLFQGELGFSNFPTNSHMHGIVILIQQDDGSFRANVGTNLGNPFESIPLPEEAVKQLNEAFESEENFRKHWPNRNIAFPKPEKLKTATGPVPDQFIPQDVPTFILKSPLKKGDPIELPGGVVFIPKDDLPAGSIIAQFPKGLPKNFPVLISNPNIIFQKLHSARPMEFQKTERFHFRPPP
jgi:RHS repeat-associated protein